MSKYYYPYNKKKGNNEIIGDSSVVELIRFGLVELDKGESIAIDTGVYETGLVILSGKCDIECEGMSFSGIGSRKNVFSGKPSSVYVPRDSSFSITAAYDARVEVAVCKVKADKKYKPFAVMPEDVISAHRGKLNWQRDVNDIITSSYEGRVDKIVLGETYSMPGQWSSYPPHKHDTDNMPDEINMEEVYHFKVNPPQGFGVQVLYTSDGSLNECYTVRDGDSIAISKGYHPVASAPGYQVYYLWVMAGKSGRTLTPYDDPDHVWMRAVEAMV